MKFARDLGIPDLTVADCGCLGNCGNGPNMVVLPEETLLHHVATTTDLVEVLTALCDLPVDKTVVKATELRLAGNALAVAGDFMGAIAKYTEGLRLEGLKVGRHYLLANRSAANLQAGDKEAALADAQAAVNCGPADFHTGWVRLIEAYYALGRYSESAQACQQAALASPSFKNIPEYRNITLALKKTGQLTTAGSS